MDSFEQQERKREARRRLAAQRGRAGRLRGRVVAGSLICFVLLWGIVFGQMVSGNDPVLAAKAQAQSRRESRGGAGSHAAPQEAIETTEPEEVESQLAAPEPDVVETPVEAEPEFAPESEVELEPLTTGQS